MQIRDNEKAFIDTQFIHFLKINSIYMARCLIIDLFIQ